MTDNLHTEYGLCVNRFPRTLTEAYGYRALLDEPDDMDSGKGWQWWVLAYAGMVIIGRMLT
jgi:hypothetical protein